jgi:hypothetical protein
MDGKRGAIMHLEMFISFVLFILFVTFLLIFVKPYDNSQVVADSIMIGLHDSFENKNMVNLTTIFIKNTDPDPSSKCLRVDLSTILGGQVPGTENSQAYCIKGPTNRWISSSLSSNILTVDKCQDFFYVFVSSEFPVTASVPGCSTPSILYAVGSISKDVVLSNKKLVELENSYKTNYKQLKKDLRVPDSVDFAIVTNNHAMNRDKPNNVNVVAKSYYEKILYDNGTVSNEEIVFQLW